MTKEEKVVHILDIFTKTWCMDRNLDDDLEFECERCAFETEDGKCLAKIFKNEVCPEYENFGSMVH